MKKLILSIGVGLISYSGFCLAMDESGQQAQLTPQAQVVQQAQAAQAAQQAAQQAQAVQQAQAAQQAQAVQQAQAAQQAQLGRQNDDNLARLQQRCQAFANHDQIKKFQVKVNFKGYFVDYRPVTSCYGLGNKGDFQLGISMKSNRFQSQTIQGKLAEGELKVPCTVIQARKIQVKADSPHLTLQLDSCDQLTKDYIQKLLISKIKESYVGDPEMYSVVGWTPIVPESCSALQKVAERVIEGDC